MRKEVVFSEVSLRIRFPIPRAAFGVDFFILLSPNMKKGFILYMALRSFDELNMKQTY